MLETGPKLCQCDDLHKLETFSKLYNLIQTLSKVLNITSQLIWPTQSVNTPVLKYSSSFTWPRDVYSVCKQSQRESVVGMLITGKTIRRRKKKDRGTVLSREAPESDNTDVLCYLIPDQVWIKMVVCRFIDNSYLFLKKVMKEKLFCQRQKVYYIPNFVNTFAVIPLPKCCSSWLQFIRTYTLTYIVINMHKSISISPYIKVP